MICEKWYFRSLQYPQSGSSSHLFPLSIFDGEGARGQCQPVPHNSTRPFTGDTLHRITQEVN